MMLRAFLKRVAVVGTTALALVAFNAPKADAAFIAYICDDAACTGGGDTIVTDGGAGDTSSVTGVIAFSATTGGLSFVGNTSFSKPNIGSASSPQMDLVFSASGIGEAWLYASDTGFTGAGLPFQGVVDGNATGGSTLTVGLFGGNSNANLDLTSGVTSGPLTSSSFHANLTKGAASVNPYSLTLMAQIARTSSGITSGDFNVTAVPEPGSMVLLGTGMFALAGAARRHFKLSRKRA